jgi:hypothetical protein
MAKKKKTVFVTFSSKYLKTQTSPSYQDFVSVIKNTGFTILHEWFNKKMAAVQKECILKP